MSQRDRQIPAERFEPELQAWSSGEDTEFDNEPEYKLQLYSLLVPSIADSFLQPQNIEPLMNPCVQQLQESMRGQVTAEGLWHAIRESSRSQWPLVCSQRLQGLAKQAAVEVLKHSRPDVDRLRNVADMQQGIADAVLRANPPDDLNDTTGQVGPSRFLAPGLVPTLIETRGTADQKCHTQMKRQKIPQQHPAPTPHRMKWDGKPYRFLTDDDASAVEHSAWWRHLNREKQLDPRPTRTTRFSLKDVYPRNSENFRSSIQVCLIKHN
ncbi:uncharacterized protein LOC132210207 [Stegostoma tigrinum]|uniref:uncharacterized protein LOC132210207 n=1 Tax=Stegostoma tigrinum TaxID=3053191 RepID=UPI0028704E35|nr:uncharacterized protein LOC132210207 [Stegostoma tigrinum]